MQEVDIKRNILLQDIDNWKILGTMKISWRVK